jgi:probable biosynthetic protein (TIGR04098 family)
MYRSRASLHIGMPHTQAGGLSEVALLAHAGDLRWRDVGAATGVPASLQRDAEGRAIYASFYFVDLDGFPAGGLAAYRPDDRIEIVSTLLRFGRSMLDGEHALYDDGRLPAELPPTLPPAPRVRLSNVFVCEGSGPDDLRITRAREQPHRRRAGVRGRARLVPLDQGSAPGRPVLRARRRRRGALGGARTVVYPINPDRDVNGVGLVYFANYVAFMDFAERRALEDSGAYAAVELDGRMDAPAPHRLLRERPASRHARRRNGGVARARRARSPAPPSPHPALGRRAPHRRVERREGAARMRGVTLARALLWGVVYAVIVVGVVVLGRGGPSFIYQGF